MDNIYDKTVFKKIKKEDCTACTACLNACPRNCIEMVSDNESFLFPQIIELQDCINCGVCASVCPLLSFRNTQDQVLESYAAMSLNIDNRLSSSSGGVFFEIAKYILEKNGFVYGAAFDKDYNVIHRCIKRESDILLLKGAKYVQSDLGNTFNRIKEDLNYGYYVLFAGTPCQVYGLKSFLKRDYERLLCVDFICHGVPAPLAWKKYVEYRSRIDNSGEFPVRISMRDKKSGWSNYTYSISFEYSNNMYTSLNVDDPYMRLYTNDCLSRLSCYNCKFRGYYRISDFTLGDFWGVWNCYKHMDDNKGTSALLIHTQKGSDVFSTIKTSLKYVEVKKEDIVLYNPSLIDSPKIETKRNDILSILSKYPFDRVLKYLPNKRKKSLIGFIKWCIYEKKLLFTRKNK